MNKIFAVILCIATLLCSAAFALSVSATSVEELPVATVKADEVTIITAVDHAKTNFTDAHRILPFLDKPAYNQVYSNPEAPGYTEPLYLEYKINVESAGTYELSVGVSWPMPHTQISYTIDGGEVIEIKNEYFSNGTFDCVAATNPITVDFTAGEHTVRTTVMENTVGSIYSLNVVPAGKGLAPAFPFTTRVGQTMNSEKVDVVLDYGYRAIVMDSFKGFGFKLLTSRPNAFCTISIYEWDTNYNKTVAGEPIASESFKSIKNGQYYGLSFEESLPAGEYLFLIHDAKELANCLFVESVIDGAEGLGLTYIGTVEDCDMPSVIIDFTEHSSYDPVDFFGFCDEQIEDDLVEDDTTTVAEETTAPTVETTAVAAEETTATVEADTTASNAVETTADTASSGGCGSVVGSVSVMALVTLLGAAVALKKKDE